MGLSDESRSREVRSLRGVRVLVAAADVAFVRAAAFLLARRGFLVEAATEPGEFLSIVERTAPDVVILDATGSRARTARTALAVEGLCPRTRVLLVSEDGNGANGAFPAFGKWTSLEPLITHIERLHGRPTPFVRRAV